ESIRTRQNAGTSSPASGRPLTPALSPRERENRKPLRQQDAVLALPSDDRTNRRSDRICKDAETSSPSPGGEGRGEGGLSKRRSSDDRRGDTLCYFLAFRFSN